MKLNRAAPPSGNLPAKLSQTAAFKNLNALIPADGIIPYTVNSPLWSDGAEKKRWIALPNNGSFNTAAEKVSFSAQDPWEFPEGTVIIKHFELPIDARNPSLTKRLETRFIVVGKGGRVYGVTYKWLDDQTDALLLADGTTQAYAVTDASGKVNSQSWHFPGRSECLSCHNVNAGQVLGVNTHQLNGELLYPESRVKDNQLNTWNHLGIFDQDIGKPKDYDASVPLDNPKAIREYKIRSYIASNCAHCHQPNGVDAAFDARLQTKIENQGLIKTLVESATSHENFIVLPGAPAESEFWIRDNSTGPDAMPPIGKTLVDEEYMSVLTSWINNLEPTQNQRIGEVGKVVIDHRWKKVNFKHTYKEPVFVAGNASFAGGQPTTVRVRNLTANSCEIRLEEWECLDGNHLKETVGYLIAEAGTYRLPNGKLLMAGNTTANHQFKFLYFPEAFPQNPVILLQATSTFEASTVTTRINHRNSDNSKFSYRLQEAEGRDGVHLAENLSWIAIEEGKFDGYLPFEIGTKKAFVEEAWVALGFSQHYEHAPVFLGQIGSYYGGDNGNLRYRNLEGDQVEVLFQEEQCGDAELNHYKESVHFAAFKGAGTLFGTTVSCQMTNLAMNKPAKQSSTYDGLIAAYAVDGLIGGDRNNNNDQMAHTDWDVNPWWEVDLQEVADIKEVQIYNRTDCCQDRLNNIYVFVSEKPFTSTDLEKTKTQTGVHKVLLNEAVGRPGKIAFNKKGRYVRIQSSKEGYFNIPEVKVMGCGKSAAARFTSPYTPDPEPIPMEVKAYPNPFREILTIDIKGDNDQKVNVQVVNMVGQSIYSAEQVNTNRILRLGADWPAGMYIIRVTGDGYKQKFRMVKAE